MPLIVCTGVNGFIGTNICEKILSSVSHELGFPQKRNIRFSNFETDKTDNIIHVLGCDLPSTIPLETSKRFSGSTRYSYCDYEELFKILENSKEVPAIIIHNGACSSTTETNETIFNTLNIEYSQRIWKYCVKHNVPLIYASSAAVYGNGEHGFSDKKEDCHKYTALNLYGQSKLKFDLWAFEQEKTPPTWFGLRYFNVFGQHEGHKKNQASMVYHGYFQAIKTGRIKLFKSNSSDYKDGEQLRDFIYIDDIVRVTKFLIKTAIRRKENASIILPQNGLFLNVGTGIPHTWNELASNIFSALNLPTQIEYIEMPENLSQQYQNYTCADLSLLMSLYPEYKSTVFKDAIKRYIHAFLLKGLQ